MAFFARSFGKVKQIPVLGPRYFTISHNTPWALPQSSFIEVSGVDTQKFLQGLCTNDLTKLNQQSPNCMPAAFLTAKGRIFTNTLVYMNKQEENVPISVILELNKAAAGEFQRYLTMYKLRSKVTIKSLPWSCEFIPGPPLPDTTTSKGEGDVALTISDPRVPGFGSRIIRTVNAPDDIDKTIYSWYERYKLVHGLADGPETHARIPLECNLDLLGYVSFTKGCYVGQELTARTKFKGLVRKRLVPFLLARSAHEHAAGNMERFQPLSAELKDKLCDFKYDPSDSMIVDSVLGVGSRVYADVDSAKSIGEVVHVDSTGTIGVAMIQQAALSLSSTTADANSSTSSNAAINLVVRKPVSAQPGEEEAGSSSVVLEGLDSGVGFISTFRPDWFHGLDERTGNVQDL